MNVGIDYSTEMYKTVITRAERVSTAKTQNQKTPKRYNIKRQIVWSDEMVQEETEAPKLFPGLNRDALSISKFGLGVSYCTRVWLFVPVHFQRMTGLKSLRWGGV